MHNPLSTILAATDFSFAAHRAARRAGVVAQAHAASLQLLHVLDDASATSRLRRASAPELHERMRLEAQRSLASLAEDVAKASGAVAAPMLREGRAMEEILAAAQRADLVVLGARGRNPLRDFFLGATAERIARMIATPMLVVNQDPQVRYEHVLVPVDFSNYSAPALQFAARFAPEATLHVFHAFDDSLEATLRSAGVATEAIASYHESLVSEAHAALEELTVGQRSHVVSVAEAGDARTLINRRAQELGCTLIVMGKQGRSWLGEHLVGSVTRQVLERATCDVVVWGGDVLKSPE